MVNDVVIVAAARTPITKAIRGTFANVRAEDLAIAAITGALDKVPAVDRASIDDFITGSWMHAGSQGGKTAPAAAFSAMTYDGLRGTRSTRGQEIRPWHSRQA